MYSPTIIGIITAKEAGWEQKGHLPESGEIAIKSGPKECLCSLKIPKTILTLSSDSFTVFRVKLLLGLLSFSCFHSFCDPLA